MAKPHNTTRSRHLGSHVVRAQNTYYYYYYELTNTELTPLGHRFANQSPGGRRQAPGTEMGPSAVSQPPGCRRPAPNLADNTGTGGNRRKITLPRRGTATEQQRMELALPGDAQHQHSPGALHPAPPRSQEVGTYHKCHHPHFTDEETEAKG